MNSWTPAFISHELRGALLEPYGAVYLVLTLSRWARFITREMLRGRMFETTGRVWVTVLHLVPTKKGHVPYSRVRGTIDKYQDGTQVQFFKQSLAGLNTGCSFFKIGCHTKIKEFTLPYYQLIAGRRIVELLPFLRVLNVNCISRDVDSVSSYPFPTTIPISLQLVAFRAFHIPVSWLIAFHIALITLGKVWIELFSLQLNSRADGFFSLGEATSLGEGKLCVISCESGGVGKYDIPISSNTLSSSESSGDLESKHETISRNI